MLKKYLKFVNGEKDLRYKFILQKKKKGFNPFNIELKGGLKKNDNWRRWPKFIYTSVWRL